MMYKAYEQDKPTDVKPREVWREKLLEAADILEERGHCKASLRNALGQVCAVGAILIAHYGDTAPIGSANAGITINEVNKALGSDLVEWNNHPERTGQEVIDLFRRLGQG